MRRDITIAAEARETRGKNEARRLRVRGFSPAVVYGAGQDPIAIAVNPKEVNQILRSSSGHNTIFNVEVNGEKSPVMVVDWQHDPLKGNLLHLDLQRIDLTKRITVKVPIHTTGDPRGVKTQGGLHDVVTREIEIECLPNDIPEHFTVDVTELLIGQSIRASEIPLTGSMKLMSSPDAVISHVVGLKAEVAEVEEVAAVPEPELIKKGKKEEEAAEEKEKEKKKK
ncbi:MAG: 50S ribosomal protein L25 [Bryobacteraceae bacterium]